MSILQFRLFPSLSLLLLLIAFPFLAKAQSTPSDSVSRVLIAAINASPDNLERIEQLLQAGADLNFLDSTGQPALYAAIKKNHPLLVKLLIENGANVNYVTVLHEVPLSAAVENGNIEIVQLLLANGALANGTDSSRSPIAEAARAGHLEIVELLLAKGADVNPAGKYQQNPLITAIYAENKKIVKLLLAHGARPNLKDSSDHPLNSAAVINGIKVGKMLIAHGADVNHRAYYWHYQHSVFYYHTPLYDAVTRGHIRFAKLLLRNGANPTNPENHSTTYLLLAIEQWSPGLVRLLLEKGANPNAGEGKWTALHSAVIYKNKKIVKLLLEHRATPNVKDSFEIAPLRWAFSSYHRRKKSDRIVSMLVMDGADLNNSDWAGYTPLHYALLYGYHTSARIMIESEADIHARNQWQQTPLFFCFSPEVTRLLLAKGAEVDALDSAGNTPLFSACQKRNASIARILMKSGADVNMVNKDGITPLFIASTVEGKKKTIRRLVRAGAKVNVHAPDGKTPLHYTIFPVEVPSFNIPSNEYYARLIRENPRATRQLLKLGAEVDARDTFGATPLFYAFTYKPGRASKALIKHGADVNARANDGTTPLHHAVLHPRYHDYGSWPESRYSMEQVELLLENGADANAQASDGTTPLHHLAFLDTMIRNDGDYFNREFFEMAEMLIKHGAQINARDRQGRTPLDIAKNDAFRTFLTRRGGVSGASLKE